LPTSNPPILRGAVRQLWETQDFEAIVSGPAETGKTWGCLRYAHRLLQEHPGAQGVIVRKVQRDLVPTCLQTYYRILQGDPTVQAHGGRNPVWFDYQNGSRMWTAGLDNPRKALSSERDFIYVNQAEDLTLDDWEILSTRCSGRGAVMPFTRLFGDCNPGPPSHWIKQRKAVRLLESRHEDNPALFDRDGNITAQGERTIAILDALTGVRYQRLRLGRWAQAEGAVYPNWDPDIHVLDYSTPKFPFEKIPDSWPRYWAVDFGYVNPFVWGAFAEDPDGRLILYREIYMTRRLVEDHCRTILSVTGLQNAGEGLYRPSVLAEPMPESVICDHDAEDRATLERKLGLSTTTAHKAVSDGIQAVQERLRVLPDGKARFFVMRDALVETDLDLAAAHRPTCTTEEFESYVWQQTRPGKPDKEQPVKMHDHGLDMVRYQIAQRDLVESGSGYVTHDTFFRREREQAEFQWTRRQ
jgi:hypothetical protein